MVVEKKKSSSVVVVKAVIVLILIQKGWLLKLKLLSPWFERVFSVSGLLKSL